MVCSGMVHIRRAQEGDAGGIAEAHVRTWQHAYRGLLPDGFLRALNVESRERWWSKEIHVVPESRRPWIAESAGEVGGFISVGPSRDVDAAPGTGEVYAIYVMPECWDRGIGRNLLLHGERDLLSNGYNEATLWVLESNERARTFYEAAGWHTDGGQRLEDLGGHQMKEVRYRRQLEMPRVA